MLLDVKLLLYMLVVTICTDKNLNRLYRPTSIFISGWENRRGTDRQNNSNGMEGVTFCFEGNVVFRNEYSVFS